VSSVRPLDARFSFVACDPVETSEDLVPERGDACVGFGGANAAPRWIGVIPYEPERDRPRWHRYDAVVRVDHWTGDVAIEGDSDAAITRLLGASLKTAKPGPVRVERIDEDSPSGHAERVATVLEHIARGDVYQVNLARRLRFALRGRALDLFAQMSGKAPSPWCVYLEVNDDTTVLGTSPELALEVRGEAMRTGPIKGTRPRGTCAETDARERLDLEGSEKERAELVMAVDLHRNDLGRVARIGSVRVLGGPQTVASRTVWSRVHEVVALRDLSCDLSRVVSAVLPCGSVTGAPKLKAMEIIAKLEPHPRGLYTGAVGYVGRDGALVLAMAIRTAVLSRRSGELEYFTGGGIVAGSDPRRETDETEWKARQLP
jgi:anthranilate/para-aminobenzoate synthase component I